MDALSIGESFRIIVVGIDDKDAGGGRMTEQVCVCEGFQDDPEHLVKDYSQCQSIISRYQAPAGSWRGIRAPWLCDIQDTYLSLLDTRRHLEHHKQCGSSRKEDIAFAQPYEG